ncbi:hypothetical protein D3C73_989840 [compost metagenome]
MSDKHFSENFICVCTHFIEVFSYFHATRFTAASCMNLRLNNDDGSSKFFGRFHCFVNSKRHFAFRNTDSVLSQDFFALVLMDIHFLKSSYQFDFLYVQKPAVKSATFVNNPTHAMRSTTLKHAGIYSHFCASLNYCITFAP